MENTKYIEEIIAQLVTIVTTYGLDVIGAIVILLIGNFVSKKVPLLVTKVLDKKEVDRTVTQFLGNLIRATILIVTVLMVLAQFGVQTASLIAVLGAAGLAIGLALQGTLSNVAGGVMLLFFRPIRVGQYVEAAGHGGTVVAVNLFTTELSTPDNVQIILPNSAVWGSAIKNFSYHATRRVDLLMGIAYEDDMDKAIAIMKNVIAADDRAAQDPAPMIAVSELADSSVNFTVRVWCKGSDYWPLKFHLTKSFKEAFDKEGISIPFPQRVVHVVKEQD
ncbi:mechanosensitive ion channel family protein [Sneathiella chinensis]|uniref:Small-conductance mechanosensitive channel n=1 Tax=Sneathiella chinensis TaxID=349750 RepID=A0ABQ5U3G8_9PROT|nr:mechanosensitive ion channel domain-containing protein [Sneathiella chinensis]GLQ06705.1 mechanosensitive ion channel protein [Sneathiella chinensis]